MLKERIEIYHIRIFKKFTFPVSLNKPPLKYQFPLRLDCSFQ